MELYTVQEVAKMLKVSDITVIRFIKDNKLKAVKIGNQYRIKEKDLNDFINEK
jgi:excisionase family DNA binding protein